MEKKEKKKLSKIENVSVVQAKDFEERYQIRSQLHSM